MPTTTAATNLTLRTRDHAAEEDHHERRGEVPSGLIRIREQQRGASALDLLTGEGRPPRGGPDDHDDPDRDRAPHPRPDDHGERPRRPAHVGDGHAPTEEQEVLPDRDGADRHVVADDGRHETAHHRRRDRDAQRQLDRQPVRAEPQRDDEDRRGDHHIGGGHRTREPGSQDRHHRDARADRARCRALIEPGHVSRGPPEPSGRHDRSRERLSRHAEGGQAAPSSRARLRGRLSTTPDPPLGGHR